MEKTIITTQDWIDEYIRQHGHYPSREQEREWRQRQIDYLSHLKEDYE